MNVLIFTTVLIMVLTSLSYSQIKIFYRQALTHTAWVRYMDTIEGCLFNNQVDAIYHYLPKKKGDKGSTADSLGHQIEVDETKASKKKNESIGSKRINFRILLGKEKKLTPEAEEQFHALIKNLIEVLYSNANFYKEALANRPEFLEELLSTLKIDFKDDKINHLSEIKNLILKDAELNKIFYFMIKNNPDESKEKNPCAQLSLLDFFTDSYRTEIRVFLAQKETLLAAFKDEQIVKQIIEKRKELYEEVNRDSKSADQATEEFEQAFQGYSNFKDILDFSVTKTNPDTYR